MSEVYVADYYHTGKYALEYMTSNYDILASLEVGDAKLELVVEGKAKFFYKQEVYKEEHHLTDKIRKLIGRNDKMLDIRFSPEFKLYFTGYSRIKEAESLHFTRLPSTLMTVEFMKSIMMDWLRDMEREGSIGKDEQEFLKRVPSHSYQVQLFSNMRTTTAYNQLEGVINSSEEILLNAKNVQLTSEKDNHDRKWLSISYDSDVKIQHIIAEEMKKLGTPGQ